MEEVAFEDVETKLQQLKTLVERDLITEEDFKKAKKLALQQFIQPSRPIVKSTPNIRRATPILSQTHNISLPSPILETCTQAKQDLNTSIKLNESTVNNLPSLKEIKEFLNTDHKESSFTLDDSFTEQSNAYSKTKLCPKVEEINDEEGTISTVQTVDISTIVDSKFDKDTFKKY